MDLTEKTIKKNILFEGKILTLRRDDAVLSDGTPCVREVVEHSGGVGVLAEVDGEILFVRQFRYPYGEEVLEIPAGKLNRGEDPGECGKRELTEETGYAAAKWTNWGHYFPSPGYTNERIYLYYAEDLVAGKQQLDPDEYLSVVKIPIKTVKEMLKNNEIRDAKTVIALGKFFMEQNAGK